MSQKEDPEARFERLKNELVHGEDWRQRDRAARDLGYDRNTKAIEHLIRAILDPHPEVRSAALGALGSIGDASVVDFLIKALQIGDEYPKAYWTNAAASSLGQLRDVRAVEPLIKRLGHPEVAMKLHAADALGNIGDKRAVGPLITCLDDEDYFVREHAAINLGQIGDTTAVEPLIKCLADPNKLVRGWVIKSLGKLRDRRAVAPLLEIMNGSEQDLLCFASDALGEIGDAKALQALIRFFENADYSSGVRLWAGGPIGKVGYGNDTAFEVLMRGLSSEDPLIRTHAARGLGYLREKKAIPALEKARRHDKGADPEVGDSVKAEARVAIKRIMEHYNQSVEPNKPNQL